MGSNSENISRSLRICICLARQYFCVKWRFSALALRSGWLLTDLNCLQVSTPVLSFVWTLYGDLSRLPRVIFVTCISFPVSTRNATETFAGTFCCFHARLFGLKNARVFFQMFSIQYFILDPKSLRFPCCRSFFGQRIGWRKAKRSADGLYAQLRFVSLKEPDWQRAINNSLPNVNTIFNSCSIGNTSNILSLNNYCKCCSLKNRRLSRLIAVKTSSFVQCLRLTNVFQKSWDNYQMLSLTVMSKIISPTTCNEGL